VTLIYIFVLHNKRPRSLFSAFKGQFEISERSNAIWWPNIKKNLAIEVVALNICYNFYFITKLTGGFLKAPGWLFRYCPNNKNKNKKKNKSNNNNNNNSNALAAGKNAYLVRIQRGAIEYNSCLLNKKISFEGFASPDFHRTAQKFLPGSGIRMRSCAQPACIVTRGKLSVVLWLCRWQDTGYFRLKKQALA
jgi:hypothetical protein